jgi:NTE family protein
MWRRPSPTLPLSLALQGGGAHGAFTWGVLDGLLESGRFHFDAVSGSSAGAMNALLLADGLARGGPEGAREALDRFWDRLAAQLPTEWLIDGDPEQPGLAPGVQMMLQWVHFLSPYQLNPLGLNPLADLLRELVDFERLRRPDALRLYIAATRADTGRLRLFGNAELSVDVALASACLPTLHHAVEIDGQPYWDGGYCANPALFPLVQGGHADDLLIVMLSLLQHPGHPTSAAAIRTRVVEITFNATFQREAALLGQACRFASGSWLSLGPFERRLRRLRCHLIDAQEALGHLGSETKLLAHRPFLLHLKALGRQRATRWLDEHGAALGRRSTVDLETLFG